MARLQEVLAFPAAYRLLGRLIGRDSRSVYVAEYLKARPGERVLDLGCGPGDILRYLPACDYVGVDIDPGYVEAAQKRYGPRGTFRCLPVEDFVVAEPASFDLVMANGVLHHLDDEQAAAMLRVAAGALKPGGRLVTLDGCFVPGQSWVAKALLRMDRGKFVRERPAYEALARGSFARVEAVVRHDLLSLPYTLLIMTCRQRPA